MAYDGLTYTWPTGQKAGIPWDLYQAYNPVLYDQYGKKHPNHSNIVIEPDGASWQYYFSYDDPFNYYTKQQITLPTVTPGGELLDPGGALTPYIPGPGEPPYDPNPVVIPAPVTPETPATPAPGTGDNGDLIGIAGLALLGLGLGYKFTRKRKK
jgi:LPXTG-motif cell wall-anchored protein